MGLEQFTEDDNTDEESEEYEPSRSESTKRAIAANIQSRCMKLDLDLEVDNGRIEGDIEDLSMLFALMTMDMERADFYELVTDDLD